MNIKVLLIASSLLMANGVNLGQAMEDDYNPVNQAQQPKTELELKMQELEKAVDEFAYVLYKGYIPEDEDINHYDKKMINYYKGNINDIIELITNEEGMVDNIKYADVKTFENIFSALYYKYTNDRDIQFQIRWVLGQIEKRIPKYINDRYNCWYKKFVNMLKLKQSIKDLQEHSDKIASHDKTIELIDLKKMLQNLGATEQEIKDFNDYMWQNHEILNDYYNNNNLELLENKQNKQIIKDYPKMLKINKFLNNSECLSAMKQLVQIYCESEKVLLYDK